MASEEWNGSLPDGQLYSNGDLADDLLGEKYDTIEEEIASEYDSSTREARALPEWKEVQKQFLDYLELIHPISEEQEEELLDLPLENKWKCVQQMKNRAQAATAASYVSSLNRHVSTTKRVKVPKKVKAGSSPLEDLLAELKQDLARDNSGPFLGEFVTLGGVDLLVSILHELQTRTHSKNTLRKKPKNKERTKVEEYNCLMCVYLATQSLEAGERLLQADNGVNRVLSCVLSDYSRTRTLTIQVLSNLAMAPGGFQEVMNALNRMRIQLAEHWRFGLLVSLCNNPTDAPVRLQAACLRLFNTLLAQCQSGNPRLFLQHEMQESGYDVDSPEKYGSNAPEGPDKDAFFEECDLWRKNYVSVITIQQERNLLDQRCTMYRQEVDNLTERMKNLEKKQQQLEKEQMKLEEKSNNYRERAAGLQDAIHKITRLYEEQTHLSLREEIYLDDVMGPLDEHAQVMSPEDRFATIRSRDTLASSLSSLDTMDGMTSHRRHVQQLQRELAEPPPAPPMPPPFISSTVRKKVLVHAGTNMPMLNWTPLISVRDTIFEDMDDDAMLRTLSNEFRDFEVRFRLQAREESSQSRDRRQRAFQQAASKVRFVDVNRAKNMMITKKKIDKSAREIREAIARCDTSVVAGEYAELLLKYVPNNEELKAMSKNTNNYGKMGEAEQFLFQIAQVERLENCLEVMALMDVFDDIVNTVSPMINCIHRATESVLGCRKLAKIFEVILATGNFLNSSKRGYALGFKLESLYKLSDVKSYDRKETLLHYFVELIARRFPELDDFDENLNLVVPRAASYEALKLDIKELRGGVDLVQFEKDRQPYNENLRVFYTRAADTVANVAADFHKMESHYKELCVKLGESARHTEPGDLFGTLSDFVNAWQTAREEIKARKEEKLITKYNYSRTKSLPNIYEQDNISPEETLERAKRKLKPIPDAQQNGPSAQSGSGSAPDVYDEATSAVNNYNDTIEESRDDDYHVIQPGNAVTADVEMRSWESPRRPHSARASGPYDDVLVDLERRHAPHSTVYASIPPPNDMQTNAVPNGVPPGCDPDPDALYEEIPAYADGNTKTVNEPPVDYTIPPASGESKHQAPAGDTGNTEAAQIKEALSALSNVVEKYADGIPAEETMDSQL